MTALALLIPGGNGQLGHDLVAQAPEGSVVHHPGSRDLDVTQAGDVVRAIDALLAAAGDLSPVVINAAAYTAVDAAETDRDAAYSVNADGPRLLAAVCASRQVPLIQVSTDYVFSGDKAEPYEVDDAVSPQSVYGITKLAGESSVLRSGAEAWVVRTSWVYGASGSANFVKSILRLAGERDSLSVVDDQRGSPTWSADLATGLLELAGLVVAGGGPRSRVLHCTGGGETTWYGFARAIFEELGTDPERVKPCTTAEFPRPAKRPANSVLSPAAWAEAGLTPLRPWRAALSEAFPGFATSARG
ncbi:dTDP-4-dehydrorhamnose reductase [Kibdelosporangium phytohabitans]|uniref:dTDP-4-dehydrorhamnose reductase n=1 Tax=Kibdelosporangium phytohabitans TaxID=860235 RepID=A0A0N9IKL6_9PSEU|nr:dTDP-4-dehydrorhamnose reductase [Kibdelosporangium phytohabitans]ALG15620.1 dTDP-4-dehydrorhamnose reductase [Kibdelosporangium phytohabitans]MBE1465496.1 dTDP-4-dehydrorhamnose reductase [Kibdelosporangium phytohabitans]